ncbi:signal transduction histidine kinase [Microbacterium sp. AG790]|uniref:sensor histidine kinase n=1 Tax=Microbacterium sp. AG790 TaxID=2183995 RepID=UPI000EB115E7|nr:HAMP domain-containing sensor histidine kinase [Microbacterium sp. AG790]RKS89843.1 signal transduction histidine kinase [Microbacterium sp. AG790]
MTALGVDHPVDRRTSPWQAAVFWLGGALLIFVLSIVAVSFSVPGVPVALWWPAAGVSVVLILRAPRHRRAVSVLVVLVATIAGNLVAGRSLEISGLYGLANAIEATLLSVLLLRGGRDARLRTTTDAVQFVALSALSALVFALLIALINITLVDGEPLASALVTCASHLSAVLLIVPLALFDAQPQPPSRPGELAAQILAMLAVIAACIGPLSPLPLAFLVFVPLAWASLRFPPLLAQIQALFVALTTMLFSPLSIGVFDPARIGPVERAITVAAFVAALAIFTVLTTTERNESLRNARTAVDAADESAEAARATAATIQVRYDLERQRQDFLSTTSHELRTPITIIAGYSELLSEADLPAEAAAWVDAIHRNTGRLSGMLDDLLAFSRTRAERPRPREIAASDLVNEVVADHTGGATTRSVEVDMASAEGFAVFADRDDAARALGNLLSNALKFTPPGGDVRVEIAGVAADVMLTVSDTGPGIGTDALAQVFDPFYRGEQAEVRATPGTGLGLPIARMLARRNGGEVMIVSLPGHGTKATLLLPRPAAPAVPSGTPALDGSAESDQ